MAIQKLGKAGVVCCSNGQPRTNGGRLQKLCDTLTELGLEPVLSDCIYADDGVFCGTGKERAEALMDFYKDQEIKVIFDISGGDVANQILPYLDFDLITKSEKEFWGYSDLTAVINAIYAKTGKRSVLYQIRNLIGSDSERQINDFSGTIRGETERLFDFSYEFVQGSSLEGVVVGGNIRCLLKLAGTGYWPDMQDKILLLEARSGRVPQMTAYLSQLWQIGVFRQIRGIMLGTFTVMEQENCIPDIISLVKEYIPENMPIIKTFQIGHGQDSKGIVIGGGLLLKSGNTKNN
ncbi:MAG: LD-carboxypeptidase [Eubacteriales bacterium]|nr:LD-carboxypeptidase [Eubacteriales bacterium]